MYSDLFLLPPQPSVIEGQTVSAQDPTLLHVKAAATPQVWPPRTYRLQEIREGQDGGIQVGCPHMWNLHVN